RHTSSDRDWSSDVCSSDLRLFGLSRRDFLFHFSSAAHFPVLIDWTHDSPLAVQQAFQISKAAVAFVGPQSICRPVIFPIVSLSRSEEHTSELQSRSDLVCR